MKEKDELSKQLLQNSKVSSSSSALSLWHQIWEEKKKLWVVAGPAIFSRFSTFGVSIISMAFMGHIGATELAGYALVFTVIVRFSCGVLLGMASALETLCGQSYGAGQHHMLGIYLQRSWLVLLPCTILLLPLYIFTTPILTLLGQDEAVADAAGVMSLWFIPTISSYAMSYTLQMYLQSQSKNKVITYWAAATLIIHVFLCWLLSLKFHLGATGVMISTVVALWISVFGQLLFVFFGGCPETWKGFDAAAFHQLWPILKLSTSSGVMADKNSILQSAVVSLRELKATEAELQRRHQELKLRIRKIEEDGCRSENGKKIDIRVVNPASSIDSIASTFLRLKEMSASVKSFRSKFSSEEFVAAIEVETTMESEILERFVQSWVNSRTLK